MTTGIAQIQTDLRAFLMAALPVDVVEAQGNRVPEPQNTRFIVMTPLFIDRLGTNLEVNADVAFTASQAGADLTVLEIVLGSIALPAPLFGADVVDGARIVAQQSGEPGGTGVYTVSVPQALSERIMAAGRVLITQAAQVRYQLDFHAEDADAAASMVTTVSTLFLSQVGADAFSAAAPLSASDPKQIPFLNAAQEVEWRWTMEIAIQCDQTVAWPQQFTDEAVVTIVHAG